MTNTTTELVEGFLKQMSEQANVLSTRVSELDAEKVTLQTELTKINRALAVWNGDEKETPSGKTPGTRKPMSEAGRANIAAALQARSKRLAEAKAAVGDTVTETAKVPSEASEKQSEPVSEAIPTAAPVAAKKSAKGKTDANS